MSNATNNLRPAHGGNLVDGIVRADRAAQLKSESINWPSYYLTDRQLCDLELLLNGGFSPLRTFMGRADYESVVKTMRLADGTLWPMPIVLDVPEDAARGLHHGDILALRDPMGVMLAALKISDIYRPDQSHEAQGVFGTTDQLHAGVGYLMRRTNPFYVTGTLEGISLPSHYDFTSMRLTPRQLRGRFDDLGWDKVVAFQTRNPMHRAHVAVAQHAAQSAGAHLLIQPVVGMTKPGDVDHFTRVRIYREIQKRLEAESAMVTLLPLAMRMGGPREALWHAIIRKNYGATHFVIGRDHAGPGNNSTGKPFYEPFASYQLVAPLAEELGITIVPGGHMVYVPSQKAYLNAADVAPDVETLAISGTKLRAMLHDGQDLPEWFTYPEVARELRRTYAPRASQGITVFFTGLSGAGKSTIASILEIKLREAGGRKVTSLDGDIVRATLSKGLGFSREDRDANILRIGYVASEIAKHGGVAICAPIAPYDVTRRDVRQLVSSAGGKFVLVYVSTPLDVCEERDPKGLYQKARAGQISQFTGVSDPYEAPADAELTLDTTKSSAEQCADQVLAYLVQEGYLMHPTV